MRTENFIFYKNFLSGPFEVYVEDFEIEDLIQCIGISKPNLFVKKHIVWAWYQIIIIHFLITKHKDLKQHVSWGLMSENTTWNFLQIACEYFEKYTHLHKDNPQNSYLHTLYFNLGKEGQKVLAITNSILQEICEHAKNYNSLNKRTKDKTLKEFMTSKENYCFFQYTFSNSLLELKNSLLERGGYYSISNFNTMTTGLCVKATDNVYYVEEALPRFIGILQALLIFTYTYNNKKWIKPQPKNHKSSEETVDFFATEIYPLNLTTNLEVFIEILEKALGNQIGSKFPLFENDEDAPFIRQDNFNNSLDLDLTEKNKSNDNYKIDLKEDKECLEELEKIPVSVPTESPLQPTILEKEHTFTFNLFRHKLSIRNPFKIEKMQQPVAVSTADDFDDFIEY